MKTTRILQYWRQTSTTPCHQCRLLSWTLLLVVLGSCAWPVCGQPTPGATPGGGVSSSTQENSAYREDRNASTPWPPDEGSDQPATMITATTAPSTTTTSSQDTSMEDSTSTQDTASSQDSTATQDTAAMPDIVTKVPGARQDNNDDVTTSPNEKGDDNNRGHDYDDDDDDDGDTTIRPGFDVMQNKTFQVTLGVCMSMCGLLVVLLVLMMFYTKYRGWKDRMNVAPTVRTGGQIGTDRQELVT